jgi:hypothetical protein
MTRWLKGTTDHDGDGRMGGSNKESGVRAGQSARTSRRSDMVAKTEAAKPAAENVVAQAGNATLIIRTGEQPEAKVQKAGEKGPPSALEGGEGSLGKTNLSGDAGTDDKGAIEYSVQAHTDEKGLKVHYVKAKSGDEAASKVLSSYGYKGCSIRGVTPASDPDPNSLGGEREAAIMFRNAENGGHLVNTLGTEANAEATRELAKADVKELGE